MKFQTQLVAGKKRPYSSWTFLVIPEELAAEWGKGSTPVRGTVSGTAFRGTASRGEGVLRVALTEPLRREAGIATGDVVEVTLEIDPEPRPIAIPDELRAVFSEHPGLEEAYRQMTPSLRRAWAQHVGGAKRADTRERRAQAAPAGIRAREYPR